MNDGLWTRVELWTWAVKKSYQQKFCTKALNMSCEQQLSFERWVVNKSFEKNWEQELWIWFLHKSCESDFSCE